MKDKRFVISFVVLLVLLIVSMVLIFPIGNYTNLITGASTKTDKVDLTFSFVPFVIIILSSVLFFAIARKDNKQDKN